VLGEGGFSKVVLGTLIYDLIKPEKKIMVDSTQLKL
jgi:hypothetical protein